MTEPAPDHHLDHDHGFRPSRMSPLRRGLRRIIHRTILVVFPVIAGIGIAALVFGLLITLVLAIA